MIEPSWWDGKNFVDVGCGTGRNSYWPASYGASGVAVDLNPGTLAVARRNLSESAVEVRQGSAYELKGLTGFDIVFSLGVIHHLERPIDALRAMRGAAAPGGRVMIWVYGYEGNEWIMRTLDPLRKAVLSKLPIGVTHTLSVPPTLALWGALRSGFMRNEYMRSLRKYSFDQLRVVVFDQMLPHIANYWRRDEVIELMESAGLEDIEIQAVNEMSWCAMGIRPE